MDLEVGEHFFHYTTREAVFEHILPERRLRLSPYAWMRDPLEAQPPSLNATMAVPETEEALEELHYLQSDASDLVAKRRAEAKLLSLTIDASDYESSDEVFGRGYSRARMWEQYADGHRGVCLVFQRSELTSRVEEQIVARGGQVCSGPVEYSKTGLAGNAAETLRPSWALAAGSSHPSISQACRRVVLAEVDRWSASMSSDLSS